MDFDIINRFNNLEANPNIAFSNIPHSQNQYLTHGYHRYPAKFIPNLASYLIKNNTNKGDLICDPFGGCGTTLVEAKINGRESIGIDINPVAGLITRTKITPINPTKLNAEAEKFIMKIEGKIVRYKSAPEGRLKYWFDDKNFSELNMIYGQINKVEDRELRMFYTCAFSHILKNCSRWLMKSIKPTIDKDKKPAAPIPAFSKHLKFMVKQNQEFVDKLSSTNNTNIKAKFYLRDARNTKLLANSVDYILTSPPYVTSYEYADLHQLSILWFEYTPDWLTFKKTFMGTSHRLEKNKEINSTIGNKTITELLKVNTSLARNVRAYFEDMKDFIDEAHRILKKGKKLTLVLGDTTIKGVDILNAEIAFEQMRNTGFKRIRAEKRQTSSQSITPFRDNITGRFTSIKNPQKRRAYQFEYLLTGIK